ncbi:hypothetical protein BOTCAL_0894g00010 [Botryotinia calthae]|uniref:Carrier domain-containing protein n=1 Tax=Botryotinia calthae TaxID=38488 RepID=A0A4Y8CHL3_9HELO|nr:hypothetical protein BOTCAL_0894g00010 [Botryotinia calthae]
MESMCHIDVGSIILDAISMILGHGVDEINAFAEDSTFIKLGGDSLAAILIAAECQKSGISIPASIFLRTSTLKEAIMKAESSAQLLQRHSTLIISSLSNTHLSTSPSQTFSLSISRFSETLTTASWSSESSEDESSSLPSFSNAAITTPNSEVSDTLPCYNEQKIMTARHLLGKIKVTEWTEPQLLFLQETFNDQKRNVLTIHKAYTVEWDAQVVCNAWTKTIQAEPIFQDLAVDLDIPPQQLTLQKIIHVETEEDFERELHNAVLIRGPLSHITVVKLASKSLVVVWRVHHAFMDGFSARIIRDKISHNLLGITTNPGPSFKETVYALCRLREERKDATRRFWDNKRAQFPNAVGELSLNPQRIHDGVISQRCIKIRFSEEKIAAARASTGYTSMVYFAAAWALTLGRFMDTDQVCFGIALSGRDLPILGAFDVIGSLINILPLFLQLPLQGDRETSILSFLRYIQECILELNDFQHSNTSDGFDRKFSSIMATQFDDCKEADTSPLFDANRLNMQTGIALNLIIQGQSQLQVLYSTAHYSEKDMNNVWSVFQEAMNCFLQGDDERLLAPAIRDVMMPQDLEQTIRQWSNCMSSETLDQSKGDDLVTLFESVVARHPTAVAVTRDLGQEISYNDFDLASALIAQKLSWIESNEPTELHQNYLTTSHLRRRIARPDDLAYICFTSGSTGQPKAVQCTHKGLVAFQKDYLVRLASKKGTVVAQVMSPVFDGSIHEIFSALTYGATLQLASTNTQDHPFAHLQACDSAILTPSIANALDADQYPRLRHVYLVGEVVPQHVSDVWTKKHFVYNMYGPTEATCGATIKQLEPGKAVTLGQANPSSRVYILDRNQHLLPPGAVGELYLAGIQVSNGYIDLSSENAKRFLPDSILPEANQRMYRTGDYAYRDSTDGEIYIVGRKDRQIKLRGFRLDLDDLETRIVNAVPDCRGAAIFRRDDYLVAAYQINVKTNMFNEQEVKAFISDALPPYAVPRRILALSELPLTAAGKLDYKRLEQIDSTSILRLEIQQTMTETEKMIVHAVRDLMKLDSNIPIDRDSDITALGGYSIVQLHLASRISSFIQRKFSIRDVIDNPVISDLASLVDEIVNGKVDEKQYEEEQPSCLNRSKATAIPQGSTVSPMERVWFSRYQQNLGTSSFNVTHVSELDNSFDQHPALISAWTTVLERHTILRCRFRPSTTSYQCVERFYAAKPPKALYIESFEVRDEVTKEFSLETEHPIRVLISKRHMLVCVSHIICDYTTLDRLFEEFITAYNHDNEVEKSLLASKKCYKDLNWWNFDVDKITAKFWRSYLSGIDFKKLPPYMKKARESHYGESRMFQLSKNAMHSLETISRSLYLSMHQIVLSIVSLVLQTDSSTKQDLILGSPYLGRQEEDMSTIGLFLQPLPIRVPRQTKTGGNFGDTDITNFLLAVKDSAQSALGHSIEWTSLINLLSLSDDENLRSAAETCGANHPLFDAMVTFHERSTTGKASTLLNRAISGIEPLITWAEGAKFGIMFEFSAVSPSVITLRIEYDTSVFSNDEVINMAGRVDFGLGYLCKYMASSMKIRDLEDEILRVSCTEHNMNGVETIGFGTRLTTLV